eukprot:gb/GEZN01013014.1/.p1 GENE.gb/GEZN01013014.1/~~gb/GEZN01013014.1/.p1  ORF type:complete len:256 (-),score=50.37 gb/GEZN01013014.1/:244-1011(-)
MGACCTSPGSKQLQMEILEENVKSSREASIREKASTKTIIVITGKPGCGKGTHAPKLATHFEIPHLSTGDMLRAAVKAGTPLGKQAQEVMNKGELVSDDLMINLIKETTEAKNCEKGFILDGFPRSLAQAEGLAAMLLSRKDEVRIVVNFDVPDEILVERICGRRIHKPSGRSYHVKFAPPKEEGKDDETGEPLEQRADDNEDSLKIRLAAYDDNTKPVLEYYTKKKKVLTINGNQKPDGVYGDLMEQLKKTLKS